MRTLPVGAVSWRERTWTVPDTGMVSRRARTCGTGPYRSAVPTSLRDRALDLPSDLAADVADAEAALVALDNHIGPAELGPMSAILLRTESSSSSRIENLTVGARQLALAEIGESTSSNAHLVVSNVHAMEAALALAHRLDLPAVLSMQRALMAGDPIHGPGAGELRGRLVWIGTSSVSPIGAEFIPPEPEDVPPAMDDLISFMRRDDLPLLLQAAIAHAQFETIHPFTDGNGRTGRALVHALLHGAGLVQSLTAPISAGLLHDVGVYTAALGRFRAGDARPIVEQFAGAARYAAVTGENLVSDLRAQLDASRGRLAGLRPQAAGWRLLPLLVAQPVVNAAFVVRALKCSDTTAQRAIAQLVDAGVLDERTGRSRNRVWQHPGVLHVLDGYAEDVRRR